MADEMASHEGYMNHKANGREYQLLIHEMSEELFDI
jgi:hypothetical protein